MNYDPRNELRDAGILRGDVSPAVEQAFATLTKEETDLLISLKARLPEPLPEVVAHTMDGGEWTAPEAARHGFEPAMLCMCAVWSGAGTT